MDFDAIPHPLTIIPVFSYLLSNKRNKLSNRQNFRKNLNLHSKKKIQINKFHKNPRLRGLRKNP